MPDVDRSDWVWVAGMWTTGGEVVVDVEDGFPECLNADDVYNPRLVLRPLAEPDLEHPATLGCLLAQAQAAWHRADLFVVLRPSGRYDVRWGSGFICSGETAGEALITARRLAPR